MPSSAIVFTSVAYKNAVTIRIVNSQLPVRHVEASDNFKHDRARDSSGKFVCIAFPRWIARIFKAILQQVLSQLFDILRIHVEQNGLIFRNNGRCGSREHHPSIAGSNHGPVRHSVVVRKSALAGIAK